MPDIEVIRGGLKPGDGRGRKILLDTAAPDGTPGKVNLRLDHITRRMAAHVPDRLVDLLEIIRNLPLRQPSVLTPRSLRRGPSTTV